MTNLNRIKKAFDDKGYSFFDRGLPYNVNLFAVRSSRFEPNIFNDYIYAVYRDYNKQWHIDKYPCTTDPGTFYLMNPILVEGTALLVPGQYRGAYNIGLHKGKYEALVQRSGPVKVYRDNDRDHVPEPHDPIQYGYFGINIHHAGEYATYINKWSAGCIVFKRKVDFDAYMEVAREARKIFGNRFTFTLFTEDEFIE